MTILSRNFIQSCLAHPNLNKLADAEDPFEYGTEFLKRDEIYSLYEEYIDKPRRANEAIAEIATILPKMHPYYAAQIVLLCGTFIEIGASPTTIFTESLNLLKTLVNALHPYWGYEPDEEELNLLKKENNTAELERAERALANYAKATVKVDALSERDYLELVSYQHALDILVVPFMAMLMRDAKNRETLLAQPELIKQMDDLAFDSDIFPLNELHFICYATLLHYGKFTVILPATKTGFIAHAQGISSTFHALTLAQDLIAHHADKLGVGKINPDLKKKMRASHARYNWYNATAFIDGKLQVTPEAILAGELSLNQQPLKNEEIVFYAQEVAEVTPEREWDESFSEPIHSAQGANTLFVKELTAEEVQSYLK